MLGGFYAIAVKGLGKTAGLITGIIATIGYNAFVAGALGTIGFFAGMVVMPELFGEAFTLDWFWTGSVLFVTRLPARHLRYSCERRRSGCRARARDHHGLRVRILRALPARLQFFGVHA